MHDIINALCENNSANYKLGVLKEHKSNEQLKRVLMMTYDKVAYRYYITMNHWNKPETSPFVSNSIPTLSLDDALDFLETKLSTREVTGNAAIEQMDVVFRSLSDEDRSVMTKVLNRDLRINCGRTQINKVFPSLINRPVYMRCGIYNKDTAKKINVVGAIVQLKADGTYREFVCDASGTSSSSRSGEEYEYPVHFDLMKDYPNGHYFGELTVINEDGTVMNRAEGNGLINSSAPPHSQIVFDVWDYVTPEEYATATKKEKCKTPYATRLAELRKILIDNTSPQIRLIETHVVNTMSEALGHCMKWMNDGLEGAILKDSNSVFRDGTNPQQLKLKLVIDLDLRIVGFQEGTVGTSREKTFGAIVFESDDGKIKGRTSGFTDALLKDFNSRRAEMIGKIITVQCNDITKGRDNDFYALSHPRFIEVRDDRTDTDTLQRALETKRMAMDLS
jgi:hypothetical protein